MSDARQFFCQGRASTVGGKELTGPITNLSSLIVSLVLYFAHKRQTISLVKGEKGLNMSKLSTIAPG